MNDYDDEPATQDILCIISFILFIFGLGTLMFGEYEASIVLYSIISILLGFAFKDFIFNLFFTKNMTNEELEQFEKDYIQRQFLTHQSVKTGTYYNRQYKYLVDLNENLPLFSFYRCTEKGKYYDFYSIYKFDKKLPTKYAISSTFYRYKSGNKKYKKAYNSLQLSIIIKNGPTYDELWLKDIAELRDFVIQYHKDIIPQLPDELKNDLSPYLIK